MLPAVYIGAASAPSGTVLYWTGRRFNHVAPRAARLLAFNHCSSDASNGCYRAVAGAVTRHFSVVAKYYHLSISGHTAHVRQYLIGFGYACKGRLVFHIINSVEIMFILMSRVMRLHLSSGGLKYAHTFGTDIIRPYLGRNNSPVCLPCLVLRLRRTLYRHRGHVPRMC